MFSVSCLDAEHRIKRPRMIIDELQRENDCNHHTLQQYVHCMHWEGSPHSCGLYCMDDYILTGSSSFLIEKYKTKLSDQYMLINFSPIQSLPSIKVTHNCEEHTHSLSQSTYITSMLECYLLPHSCQAHRHTHGTWGFVFKE